MRPAKRAPAPSVRTISRRTTSVRVEATAAAAGYATADDDGRGVVKTWRRVLRTSNGVVMKAAIWQGERES
jgi:hypothetical protein